MLSAEQVITQTFQQVESLYAAQKPRNLQLEEVELSPQLWLVTVSFAVETGSALRKVFRLDAHTGRLCAVNNPR